ncbi:MAG: GNAT family N-acetyltransferase [Candidatus Limnocylindrales bacterium]
MATTRPTVMLQPMTADEWEVWGVGSIAAFAADMVRLRRWPAAEAEARATAQFKQILPAGRETPGHEFRSIVAEAGETVGYLWFGPHDGGGPSAAFIWDLVIDAAFRGRGYGRAALLALEPVARELGYDAIRLHVFGDNEVARLLYRSSGYLETDVSMLKRLG